MKTILICSSILLATTLTAVEADHSAFSLASMISDATPHASMNLKVLTDADMDTSIEKGIAVVDFFASWCGPCQKYAPTFAKVAADMNGVNFFKVDVESAPNSMDKYSVRSIPTTIIFVDGKEVTRKTGNLSEPELKKLILMNSN